VHWLGAVRRGRINGGGCDINALGLLPDKLKTELALHVNLETLKKVPSFLFSPTICSGLAGEYRVLNLMDMTENF